MTSPSPYDYEAMAAIYEKALEDICTAYRKPGDQWSGTTRMENIADKALRKARGLPDRPHAPFPAPRDPHWTMDVEGRNEQDIW